MSDVLALLGFAFLLGGSGIIVHRTATNAIGRFFGGMLGGLALGLVVAAFTVV